MFDDHDGRYGVFSFASFSPDAHRTGGWSIGEIKGALTQAQADALREWIPSSLNDGTQPGNYPSKEVIAQLNRRFAWLPVISKEHPAGTWAFYASVHAGQDSTGRPGNVFTFVQTCPNGRMDVPAARLFYSEQIPAPFGKRQVDTVELPESLTQPGPIHDGVIDAFISGWKAESPMPLNVSATHACNEGETRASILDVIVRLLQDHRQVVLACPLVESALWVSAVSLELQHDPGFSFSTFETPDRLPSVLNVGCMLSIISVDMVEAVTAKLPEHVVVVSVDKPLPQLPATDVAPAGDDARSDTRDDVRDDARRVDREDDVALEHLLELPDDTHYHPAMTNPFAPQAKPLVSQREVGAAKEFEQLVAPATRTPPTTTNYQPSGDDGDIFDLLGEEIMSLLSTSGARQLPDLMRIIRLNQLMVLHPLDPQCCQLRAKIILGLLREAPPQFLCGIDDFVRTCFREKDTLLAYVSRHCDDYVARLNVDYSQFFMAASLHIDTSDATMRELLQWVFNWLYREKKSKITSSDLWGLREQ